MKVWLLALMLCSLAIASTACGSDTAPTPAALAIATPVEAVTDVDSGQSSASSSDEDQSDGDAGASHENGDGDGGDLDASGKHDNGDSDSGDTATVSRENPGFVEVPFDYSHNIALLGTQPLDLVTWTVGPSISSGELVAEGTLKDGAILFNPMVDGEGSGFSVFYKGHSESLVELLPDLGSLSMWDTTLTVAETKMETEGPNFKIRAYSPLFMDVGGSDLELRVIGYDGSGNDAVLSVHDIGVE